MSGAPRTPAKAPMLVRRLPVVESEGHLLLHNIADQDGRKALSKGSRLTARGVALLESLGYQDVVVALLERGDLHEDDAATRIAAALAWEAGAVRLTKASGGRVNFHSAANSVLYVDSARLTELNCLPGVTLATRAPFTPLGGANRRSDFATLKVIPLALPERVIAEAERLAPGILRLAPLRSQKVALLITADGAGATRLRNQFEKPTRARLDALDSAVATVRVVSQAEHSISSAAAELLESHDALVIGGQTSIMDEEDTTLRALRAAGVEALIHGAPVEPGNMMAIGYRGAQWILCAPGCARSPKANVVDLILPRLLAGEQLDRRATATLGLGGLL